jgi:hypothetical protein
MSNPYLCGENMDIKWEIVSSKDLRQASAYISIELLSQIALKPGLVL